MNKQDLPKHVAIIMDGNRRWAKKRKLPAVYGHKAGVKAFEKILRHSARLGIKYLTIYAFSTENWGRKKEEVSALMNLLEEMILRKRKELKENNVRLKILGDISAFPKSLQKKLKRVIDEFSRNTGLVLNTALNYGGRAEIIRALDNLKSKRGKVTEEDISNSLYTVGEPDPDLLIRTGGVKRLSNFLLWQLSYTELYFTDVLWPDFNEKYYDEAIEEFKNRKRRFGK